MSNVFQIKTLSFESRIRRSGSSKRPECGWRVKSASRALPSREGKQPRALREGLRRKRERVSSEGRALSFFSSKAQM